MVVCSRGRSSSPCSSPSPRATGSEADLGASSSPIMGLSPRLSSREDRELRRANTLFFSCLVQKRTLPSTCPVMMTCAIHIAQKYTHTHTNSQRHKRADTVSTKSVRRSPPSDARGYVCICDDSGTETNIHLIPNWTVGGGDGGNVLSHLQRERLLHHQIAIDTPYVDGSTRTRYHLSCVGWRGM